MKLSHIIILLAILQFFCTGQAFSQPEEARTGVLGDVSQSIREGSTEGIAKYFNDRVEITIDNVRNTYSLTQAKFVMKKYFADYPANNQFTFSHIGHTETTTYALGVYHSKNGSFEVNLFLKRSEGVEKIDRIRFDRKQ